MKGVSSLFGFAFFLLSLLCSCSTGQGGTGTPPNEDLPPFGWRSAGLIPNQDSLYRWGNGLACVTHSGSYLFVRNAKIAEARDAPAHSVFMSRQGSLDWETLQMPAGVNPHKIYADDAGLFVGTYGTGAVWHYDPASKKWTDLKVLELVGNQMFNVYGMSRLNGRLIVSMAGYNDTTEADRLIIAPILLQQIDGTWKDVSPLDTNTLENPAHLRSTPLQFHIAYEWRGDLFAATADDDVWHYSDASGEWSRVPAPNTPYWTFLYNGKYSEENTPQALTIHKGRLYMAGRGGGIYSLNDDLKSWVGIDSIRTTESGSLYANTPLQPYALASDGENLFVSGIHSGIPAVYMGNRGEPKGWRLIDMAEWCNPKRFRCLGLSTYGLDVVGDTLYAAAFEGLYKFPLADLDSAIANEESYH
jgi:hypothetical protein